jgi:hypothetical protein
METENTSFGTSRNKNTVLGSGLSGMVAAYISARAQEDHASLNEDWSAQQAFQPRWPKLRQRKVKPSGARPTLAP